ncbi:MAG: MFS transporter [Tistlia sp.]|uniref:MFS transporter n=1 Tax=Tistlia sp. TaxID=3057121 RepID=UPI0034A1D48E
MLKGQARGVGGLPAGALLTLLCGGAILTLAVGIRQGFGVFLVPISATFGWEREVFGLAVAIQNLVWGVFQPFFSIAADRYGARRVVFAATLLYGVGLWLLSVAGSEAVFYLSAGVLLGLALSGTGFVIIMGAVGRAFPDRNRGLALGVTGAMGSLGQFAMLPIGQVLIADLGWRGAASALAVLAMGCALLALGMGKAPVRGDVASSYAAIGTAIRAAGRHRGFLLLNLGFFVCGFQITFIIGHLPAYLQDEGLSPSAAAVAVGLIGLFNIAGSLLWGGLGDCWPKKYLLSLIYLGRAVLIVALVALPPSVELAYLFTAGMGVLWLGTIPLTGGLVADIFGARYLTSLFGLVFFGHQVGAFLGVWLGGLAYDHYGSYDAIWWIGAALSLVAAALHVPIDDRPLQRQAAATA